MKFGRLNHIGVSTLLIMPTIANANANASLAEKPAVEIAMHYCAAVMHNDDAAAKRLFSMHLQRLVTLAELTSKEYEQAHPGDKPPLGDGLPLASYNDAPSSCDFAMNETGDVVVGYNFPGSENPVWQDILKFEPTVDGDLRIADVCYDESCDARFSGAMLKIIEGRS